MKKTFPLLFLFVLLAGGCHDDEFNETALQLTCNVQEVEPGARYHTIRVEGLPQVGGVFTVESGSEWAWLQSETLPPDGILELWVDENTEVQGRELQLHVANAANPLQCTTLHIWQKGLGDADDNASTNPMSDFRIGWGMNAYDEYQSPASLRGRVLDLDALAALDKEDEFQSVQQVVRSQSDFMCVSATSEREMSALLTNKQDKSSNFMGVKKTMRRYSKISRNMSSQQYCSYARLTKVVASRSVDAGAIRYIVENLPDKLPFTDSFRKVYNSIVNTNTSPQDRNKLIADMINEFGTHIVIEANAGGMIDYLGTFNRNEASQLETIAEEQSKRVLGKTDSNVSNSLKSSLISDISKAASVQVKGGSPGLRADLVQRISKLNTLDIIPNQQLQEWFSSIAYTGDNYSNLDLVDFKVMPIWQIFPNQNIQQQVMQQVLKLQEQSNNQIPDQEIGTDNYRISLADNRFSFSNTANPSTSLVKVYYVNKVPILEICEEYVPKIRSDKRIQVLYPIYDGKTNHSQGLFAGDGEGNRAAFIAFYESDCYVTPIKESDPWNKLDTVFYIHGNLYERNYGNACIDPRATEVRDHRLQFAAWEESYPVVKIGSGYWIRTNIKQKMQFGEEGAGGRFMTRENVVDNLLFADIYQSNSNGFLLPNSDVYGQNTESYSGKQTLWYLPLTADLEHLKDYLGGNMKTLFKGQATGFDAQFEGYYGPYDEAGNDIGSAERRENGKKCYVSFKEGATVSQGVAMVLTPDYRWKSIVTSASFNYYPVRLFRTSYFIYKTL